VEAIREIDDLTDCVILDVKMPTHDGFWVAKRLRGGQKDVAIILHSAYQDLKDPYEVINEFRPSATWSRAGASPPCSTWSRRLAASRSACVLASRRSIACAKPANRCAP